VAPDCNRSVSFTDSTCAIRFNGIKVTVAVMGENGCGKSTAIMKGLKAYKLAEPVTTMDCPEDDALLQCGYAGFV
jgi:ABC-type Mn2+/Zn2+ transport system ATPase subunit